MAKIVKTETLSIEEYRAMQNKKRIDKGEPTKKTSSVTSKSGDKAKSEIEMIIKLAGLLYEKELVFAKPRKFRFDFAIPSLKVAVEYEGIFSEKSRHTSVTGYTKDIEKYNLATKLGWRVLRYTAMNYKSLSDDLKELIGLVLTKPLFDVRNMSPEAIELFLNDPLHKQDIIDALERNSRYGKTLYEGGD